MVKVEMYRAFNGKIFETMQECVDYEKENKEKQYEKLKELRRTLEEYCIMVSENCDNCIFKKDCGDIYTVISEEIRKFEGK